MCQNMTCGILCSTSLTNWQHLAYIYSIFHALENSLMGFDLIWYIFIPSISKGVVKHKALISTGYQFCCDRDMSHSNVHMPSFTPGWSYYLYTALTTSEQPIQTFSRHLTIHLCLFMHSIDTNPYKCSRVNITGIMVWHCWKLQH